MKSFRLPGQRTDPLDFARGLVKQETISLTTIQEIDLLRIKANSVLDPKKKSALGQFFTSSPTCIFMASLFKKLEGNIKLLDPGCGSGSLSAAFVCETLNRKEVNSIEVHTYDIEDKIKPYLYETFHILNYQASANNIDLSHFHHTEDFILSTSDLVHEGLFSTDIDKYTHVIMNPPYKKIDSSSEHKKSLRYANIETVNLYTGFVALAIKLLKEGGELVAIIPRSFCNGLYYQPFRKFLLSQVAINQIHIFDSRTDAFSDDEVLQENIIFHCIKGQQQGPVTITSSPTADFHLDQMSGTITATDKTQRIVAFDSIVKPNDNQYFIHIAANNRDQGVIDKISVFNTPLNDLDIDISTGPVVDFRLKKDLRQNLETDTVPLLYPTHLTNGLEWPKDSKKPNAIVVSNESNAWLWSNKGSFVIIKRFSSKEEKRRISATLYHASLPGELIGFDNKLNVFHCSKQGFNCELAKGLYVYLNSTILDLYYRLFGGHTQVNATDLRNIGYPTKESLIRMGSEVLRDELTQIEIDDILEREINRMVGHNSSNPLLAQKKIEEALIILSELDMPRAQQNERSALTLLALLNLKPEYDWSQIERPMIGVTPIMDWCRDFYGKEYAPNTRETFRRQTLHQFVEAGIALYNPDQPNRAVNSPKACYQIASELFDVIKLFNQKSWKKFLKSYLKIRVSLAKKYAMSRNT